MKIFSEQLNTLKRRLLIRNEIKPLRFDAPRRRYIQSLLQQEKKSLKYLAIIITLVSLIEISVPLFLDIFLRRNAYTLNINVLFWILGSLIVILFLYVFLSYRAIAGQKKTGLDVINRVRRDWLQRYLRIPAFRFTDDDEGSLYVKISYHLSLLQMGIGNSFFSFVQWCIYAVGVLLVSALLDPRILYISLAFIPLNILVFGISYVLSAYYLAKDQTLYSRLLRYIADTFNAFPLVKIFKKEKQFLHKVDHLIDIDNHFRIKREVVLRIGNSIIFTVLTLITLGGYVVNLYYPLITLDSQVASIVQIIIFGLHLRLIYLSMRMGLYYFPLKLGLYLAAPPEHHKKSRTLKHIAKLSFRSPKVRLYEGAGYNKKITFEFERGLTYLVQQEQDEKTVFLEHIFSGNASTKKGLPWVVHVDNQRMLYASWYYANKDVFYMHPQLYSYTSLYELLGETQDMKILLEYPIFNRLTKKKSFTSHQYTIENLDVQELFLVQVALCLIRQPQVVIIDARFTDMPYATIHEAIYLLSEKYHGILILHSYSQSITHKHDVIYSI